MIKQKIKLAVLMFLVALLVGIWLEYDHTVINLVNYLFPTKDYSWVNP